MLDVLLDNMLMLASHIAVGGALVLNMLTVEPTTLSQGHVSNDVEKACARNVVGLSVTMSRTIAAPGTYLGQQNPPDFVAASRRKRAMMRLCVHLDAV